MNWNWLFRNLNHQEDEDASVNPAYGAQDINMKNQWTVHPDTSMKIDGQRKGHEQMKTFVVTDRTNGIKIIFDQNKREE